MKKLIFILVFILLFSQISFARDVFSSDSNNAIRKLGSGLSNVAYAPIEFFQEIHNINAERGPIEALTYGSVLGLINTVDRIAVGISEILTFPSSGPDKDYKSVLDEPNYFELEYKFRNNVNKNKNMI